MRIFNIQDSIFGPLCKQQDALKGHIFKYLKILHQVVPFAKQAPNQSDIQIPFILHMAE